MEMSDITMQVFEKQNRNHRITFSPSEKRLTVKCIPGTPVEMVAELIKKAQSVFNLHKDSEKTVRYSASRYSLELRGPE